MVSNGKPGTPPGTVYDAAIAVGPDEEKERLQALRLRFNIPPDSPEWLFYAILAPLTTSASTDKTLEAIVERLERVEQGVDDVKGRLLKAKIGDREDVPGLRNPQMDRIEGRQNETDSRLRSLDRFVRAGTTPGIQPLAVHAVAVAVLLAVFAIGYYSRALNPVTTLCVVALVAVLAYAYLAPLLAPSLAGGLRKLRR